MTQGERMELLAYLSTLKNWLIHPRRNLSRWLSRGQTAAPAAVAYQVFNSLLYWGY